MGNNDWLDIDVLDDYLEGRLDASMMHKVERISLEDPFVAQALAGLSETKKRTQTLSILQKQLQSRVEAKPVERKMWRLVSHRLSIAATAAVLFVTVSLLFWMRENNRREQAELAANKAKAVEIDLKPEIAAAAPSIDSQTTAQTLVDSQKVEQALENTLTKGNQAIAKVAKPKSAITSEEMIAKKAILQADMSAKAEATNNAMAARSMAASMPITSVKGVVTDNQGPIPGANIVIDKKPVGVTNNNGEFDVKLDKALDSVPVEIGFIGYDTRKMVAKTNQPLRVNLKPSASNLKEVTVSGYSGKVSKASVGSPASRLPVEGWDNYQQYLNTNNKLFKNGAIWLELSFTIKEDGTVRDIKVVNGSAENLNIEAIRLLQHGPKWIYDKNKSKGYIIIRF